MNPMRFAVGIAFVALALTACEREKRSFRELPQSAATPDAPRVSELPAGGRTATPASSGPYEENAYAVSQGKRLFTWFNCVGCHFHGGGGIGPPLMDDKWIYGHEPQNVFASIVEGRPNGMPSFGGRIPEQQVWQLVAYVRSMSGLIPSGALPSRSDTLQAVEAELSRDKQRPKTAGAPRAQ
jgi:cytochrome c oxidase cbb3-type subunit III